jgi:hypothetical protein
LALQAGAAAFACKGGPGILCSMIRTPDQRPRVFVSSTLHELAAERAAARRAIERLRLTPVLFELGARPYAAAELYRATWNRATSSSAFTGGWRLCRRQTLPARVARQRPRIQPS